MSSTLTCEVGSPMLPYRLTCLGHPELRGPDGDPVRFRTRKHLALLIYLAMHPGQPHRRDRLATLLWADADMDEARHSLATALSVLRGRLGADAIDASRDTVSLLTGRVLTDLPALDAENLDDPDLAPLGPFLDEFDLSDAPDFQRWRDGTHARLLPALCACLVRRIDRCRRTGDARRMETLAHQLHRIDSLVEEGARALIEARALAGDRIGALRVFDRWRLELAEELGAIPSAELSRMADRLRRRGLDTPTPVQLAPVPTEHWKEREFIGRGAEYGVCYAAWERVQKSDPRHLLIRADSGLGKTTLVERLVTSVALEGASVARVPCYELERELPFGVIGGLVTQLLDLPGASATPPEQLAELGRLVAKVRQRWPSLPEPLPTVGEGARIQFSDAVLSLLTCLAEEHPVVVVVDDIHRSDATSLAVLHLLLRRIEEVPIMVLMTTSNRLEQEAPPARRFAENADSLNLTLLSMGPLPAVHGEALLGVLLAEDSDPGPTVRRTLLAGAMGNPMILELLVADWRRRGDASLALSLGAMTARTDGPPVEAFRRVVDGTLAALDAEARAVVQLGAILGQRLNDLSMYTLVDLPVARTMRAMSALAAHRVLRDAGSHLEFANDYLRGQCYVTMAAPMRRMLHSLVADRLLAEDGADQPIPGLEVAWHLVRGDRLPEAVPYLLAGGRESIRRGAPHEADLALSTGMPALTGAPRRTAILLWTEALQELGRWADSLRAMDTPCDPYDASEECCREVLRVLNCRWLGQLQGKTLAAETDRMLEIARGNSDDETRVKAVSTATILVALSRAPEQIKSLGEIAMVLLETIDDPYYRIHLLHGHAWCEAYRAGSQAALPHLQAGVELVDDTGTGNSIAARILLATGVTLCQTGQYTIAEPLLHRAFLVARKLDNPGLVANAASGLALVCGRLGRSIEQVDWAREALKSLRAEEWGITAISAAYEYGLGLALAGRDTEAKSSTLSTNDRFPRTRPAWVRQAWGLCKADILGLAGDERGALKAARTATSIDCSTLLHDCFAGQFARWVARRGIHDKQEQSALIRIEELVQALERYDSKDQAEIMTARAVLKDAISQDSTKDWLEVAKRLRSLPAPVAVVMRRLKLAPPDGRGGAWGIRG